MEKVKKFFSKLGKKFKENGRKLAFWFVLLVVSLTGFFYSFRAKNDDNLVSGSADESTTSYTFNSSNLVTNNYRYSGIYSTVYLRGVNTVASVRFTFGRNPDIGYIVELRDIWDSTTFYYPEYNYFSFDPAVGLEDQYLEMYRADYNNTPPLSALYPNVGVSSQFMRWWFDIPAGDFTGEFIRLNMYSEIADGIALNGIQCYFNVFEYVMDTGGTFRLKALVVGASSASKLLFESRSYYFGGFSQNFENGYQQGFDDALRDKEQAVNNAYNQGKSEGYNLGRETPTYSFISLLDAVGYSVTKPFASLLNFDLLGTNLLSLATGFISLVIIVKIIGLLI